jgi:hypothetical protein
MLTDRLTNDQATEADTRRGEGDDKRPRYNLSKATTVSGKIFYLSLDKWRIYNTTNKESPKQM